MSQRTTATGTGQVASTALELAPERTTFNAIPIIDFADACSSQLSERESVAKKIRKASVEIGFFYLKNHGIHQELVERALAASRTFFALPIDEKMALHVSRHDHHAGYIAVGGEKLHDQDDKSGVDQKESLEISIGLPGNDKDTPAADRFLHDTKWLSKYTGIRNTMHTYYVQMWELCHRLNRICALALDLPEHFFDKPYSQPITNIRLLSYPPAEPGSVQGSESHACGEHSDYLGFSLLAQDEIGGLEVLNRAGEWIQATPVPGTFVVNTGDLISHWTNDLFASTRHRVRSNRSDQDRSAIAFFTGPNFDTLIECLPSCTDKTHPPKYPPVTTGDYLYQRLSSTIQH